MSMFISRDVVFHETIFPYQLQSIKHYMHPLPISLPHTQSPSPLSYDDIYENLNLDLTDEPDDQPEQELDQPDRETEPLVRRGSRLSKPPNWMKDYVQPQNKNDKQIANFANVHIKREFHCFLLQNTKMNQNTSSMLSPNNIGWMSRKKKLRPWNQQEHGKSHTCLLIRKLLAANGCSKPSKPRKDILKDTNAVLWLWDANKCMELTMEKLLLQLPK